MQDGFHICVSKRTARSATGFGPHYSFHSSIYCGDSPIGLEDALCKLALYCALLNGEPGTYDADEPPYLLELTEWRSSGKTHESNAPAWLLRHGRKEAQS